MTKSKIFGESWMEKISASFCNQEKAVPLEALGFDKSHWPATNTHMLDSFGGYWGRFMGVNTSAGH